MAIVGYRAANHPQQVARRGALAATDDRATHPDEFAVWHKRFGFTLDVAAAAHNAKCPRYFTEKDDGLMQPWAGERVWCNPPYSDIRSWVEKAWIEYRAGVPVIVMLLPNNRAEQGWWQDLVEPYRDRVSGLRVEFLRGRLRFIQAGRSEVGPNERPPFGCCLLIWGGEL